jgi:hypothetical protein
VPQGRDRKKMTVAAGEVTAAAKNSGNGGSPWPAMWRPPASRRAPREGTAAALSNSLAPPCRRLTRALRLQPGVPS